MSQLVIDGDEDESRREWSADLRRVAGLAVVILFAVASTVSAMLGRSSIELFPAVGVPSNCTTRGAARATGAMSVARSGHTATLLRSGRVLVAGGFVAAGSSSFGVTNSAELYDPTSGTWTATGSLNVARALHSAVLLPSGKVLVIGGRAFDSRGSLQSAELYDPDKGIWTETGSLHIGRDSFPALVLRSGTVFVGVGAFTGTGGSAELYDPASGTWSETGGTILGPEGTATLLASGKVLVAGSFYSAQLYDPASDAWRLAGTMIRGRFWHTATLLPSGKVLVAGGILSGPPLGITPTAELYDPTWGTWTPTASMDTPQAGADAILLLFGNVLVAGGGFSPEKPGAFNTVQVYDPITGTWTSLAPMSVPRSYFTATQLRSGALLFAGGENDRGVPHSSAEIYEVTCARR